MNYHEWTDEEKRYLRENYRDTALVDLGFHLHVAASTVRTQLRRMGLDTDSSRRARRIWTKEELDFLKANFSFMSAIDIADHIGCSNTTVSNKARELGLKKNPGWSKNDYHNRYVGNYSGKIKVA